MRTDGTPLTAENTTHVVKMGDVQRDPDKQAPAAPPSLRAPGEASPDDTPASGNRVGTMKPVQFPKQAPDDHPVAHQGEQKPASQPDAQAPATQGQGSQDGQTSGQSAAAPDNVQQQTPDASQPGPAKPQPQGGSQQPQ